ncbi:MAG: DUF3575 domain-containing protein [Alistipes sp.]|nr:DUF3575 domain-containing protein [Alistipes sp.]
MRTRTTITRFVLLLMTLCGIGQAIAQNPDTKVNTQVASELHFRWNSAQLDSAYLTNHTALQQLASQIEALGTAAIDSVVIASQASPEGLRRHNERLAQRRAATMRSYMQQHYPALADRLRITADGESWSQLRHRIANDARLSTRSVQRLLAIIDDPESSIETKKWRLEHDPLWYYLYTTHYPQIRNSMVCLVYFHEIQRCEPLALATSQPTAPLRPTELPELSPVLQARDTLTVALKSNLLYDAATALNIELEVPIGEHFSVAAEYLFPWWEQSNKYCFQVLELGFEGRYWFRRQSHATALRGWFIGPYVMSGMYDLQYKDELNYQGEFWSTGLSAGYALPLGKRLNLELSLSVGYLSTAYRHYFPADDYSELFRDEKRGRTSYFGPTKAKVALVWPLHFSYKKGGQR